jgi:hypothetical protein
MSIYIAKTWFDGEKVVMQEIPEADFYKPVTEKSSVTLPDTLTNSDGETPEYVNGWNDCRQLMMEMIRKESK